MQKVFPAKLSNGKAFIGMFAITSIPICRLKNLHSGFTSLLTVDDPFLTSDVGHIGWLLQKDP
jgi:hypothetical protein